MSELLPVRLDGTERRLAAVYDVQGSPWAVGLDMTPAPGQTWRPSHGQKYASVCHSAITSASDGNHATAVANAKTRILDWLFVAAPRVASTGSNSPSSAVCYNCSSAIFTMGSACPTGEIDDTATSGNKGPGIDVVSVCKHPGFFDGKTRSERTAGPDLIASLPTS